MSTNYYWHETKSSEPLHIGASSAGWNFQLKVYPKLNINYLDDWIKLFVQPDSYITNEYGGILFPSEMLEVIINRRKSNGDLTQASTSAIGTRNTWDLFE